MNEKEITTTYAWRMLAWLCILAMITIFGLLLVIYGTDKSSVNRYLSPPEILPGLGVLYLFSALMAVTVARKKHSIKFLVELRKLIKNKVGEPERDKQRNMFILLTFSSIVFSMTPGATPMYRELVANYFASLLINILTSTIAAVGLFGWLCSLLLSKQSKDES